MGHTNLFIALIDFYPKGFHTRRTNSLFKKYLGPFAERGPRTNLNRLQRWRASSRGLEGPSDNPFFQQKNGRVSFLFFYYVYFPSKAPFSQTGKNGLGFRASYHSVLINEV